MGSTDFSIRSYAQFFTSRPWPTAGGRLLLAMVHRMVADRGGIVAACDPDGAHIVATHEGGTVDIVTRGEDFHEGGPALCTHALSRTQVEEIAARLEPLNPFDRSLLPDSPLRIKLEGNGLFGSPIRRRKCAGLRR